MYADDDDESLMLDINCNYDNLRQLSSSSLLKPTSDDDILRHLVDDTFLFENTNDHFASTVGS